jgi:esterase/lipase
MKKVIYVPGYIGSMWDVRALRKKLKDFELIYFDYDTSLKDSIEKTAKKLKKFIDNIKLGEGEKVNIIGMSTGGVITDYYLKFLDSKKTDRFISLCSPFRGTHLASIPENKKGLKQITRNSKFLEELSKKKLRGVKVKNFYSKFDFVVTGNSGEGRIPHHTYFFMHPLITFWPPVIRDINKFFRE